MTHLALLLHCAGNFHTALTGVYRSDNGNFSVFWPDFFVFYNGLNFDRMTLYPAERRISAFNSALSDFPVLTRLSSDHKKRGPVCLAQGSPPSKRVAVIVPANPSCTVIIVIVVTGHLDMFDQRNRPQGKREVRLMDISNS